MSSPSTMSGSRRRSRDVETRSQFDSTSTLQLPPSASLILGRAKSRATQDKGTQSLVSLERRSRDLQAVLQECLDAQVEGLLANAATQPSDTSISSSVTHKSSTGMDMDFSDDVVPSKRPISRRLGLKEARLKLWRTMKDLSEVKSSELDELDSAIRPFQTNVAQIDMWDIKRQRLENEIASVEQTAESSKTVKLREEDQALTDQINAMETKLSELKSQQRAVRFEMDRLQNNVQSRISSYYGSRDLLEKDIKTFLHHPPRNIIHKTSSNDTFLSLPVNRRTLALARDDLVEQERTLTQRREDVDTERYALVQGAKLWKDAASAVTGFEKRLGKGMQDLESELRVPQTLNPPKQHEQSLSGLLEEMEQVMKQLEDSLDLAEVNAWTLLVCCIGAELEALRRGHDILRGVATQSQVDESAHLPANTEESHTELSSDVVAPMESNTLQEYTGPQKEEDPESLLLGDESE